MKGASAPSSSSFSLNMFVSYVYGFILKYAILSVEVFDRDTNRIETVLYWV